MQLRLIRDRTLEDIVYFRELRHLIETRKATNEQWNEWSQELRGRYDTTTTMNRVGMITLELARYVSYFYELVDIKPKTNWKFDDLPTPQQLQQYLTDINKVREVVKEYIKGEYVLPNTMDNLSMKSANDIESVLYEIYELLKHFVEIFPASGIAYSGLMFYPVTKQTVDDNV